MNSSNFIFIFQDYFDYSGSLACTHGFVRMSLSIFAKRGSWDFDRDCVKSIEQFGEYYHLSNVRSSDP